MSPQARKSPPRRRRCSSRADLARVIQGLSAKSRITGAETSSTPALFLAALGRAGRRTAAELVPAQQLLALAFAEAFGVVLRVAARAGEVAHRSLKGGAIIRVTKGDARLLLLREEIEPAPQELERAVSGGARVLEAE